MISFHHRISNWLLSMAIGCAAVSCQAPGKAGQSGQAGKDIACIFEASEGLQRALSEEGLYGYLDSTGKWAILPQFLQAFAFHEGLAIVAHSDSAGGTAYSAIDRKGSRYLPIPLDGCVLDNCFSNGLLRFRETDSGRWGFINRSGKTVIFLPDTITLSGRFNNGKAMVKGKRCTGYINTSGEVIRSSVVPAAVPIGDKAVPAAEAPHSIPHQSIVEKTEWKNIRYSSPFYAEAQKVLQGQLPVEDARRRTQILNYVEHLRTSYTTKDLDFLEQLFSENALIVVGKVIRTSPEKGMQMNDRSKVVYNMMGKRKYMEHLRRIFQANAAIDVRFSEFSILRHPTAPDLYGVTLRQKYDSSIYSDEGWLFLLWDFSDETMPKIHVRTWQETDLGNGKFLQKDSVFNLSHFNLG